MKVTRLQADALPDGRIALSWIAPDEPAFRGVRVLRRLGRYPDLGDIGTDVQIGEDNLTPRGQPATYVDGPLPGETVYYYALAAYDMSNRSDLVFASAMASVPYGTASHLYRNLPEIYQLFDRVAARDVAGLSPQDRDKGPLRRLVELFGQTFDVLRSATSGIRTLHDVERVDGALLPLLAQWIGQASDTTLDLAKQRNEIRYAPHYYRTGGTPSNLRAAVNRFTRWDAKIKEFVHNVFLASHPEQLTIWEIDQQGGRWQSARNVNLEAAFEGRVSLLRTADERTWMFYHALQGDPARPSAGQWQLFAKVEEQGAFLPSFRLTAGSDLSKHPSAVQRPDGTIWLFYSRYRQTNARLVPGIALELLSAGRPALPARVAGTVLEPFALAEGDTFQITIGSGPAALERTVTVRPERINGVLNGASAEAVAQWLDRELPGVDVAVQNGAIVLSSLDASAAAKLDVAASPVAAKLGIPAGAVTGQDATPARLTATASGPFQLADGDTLVVKVDRDSQRTLTFGGDQFADIAKASAAEIAAAIESQLAGIASVSGGALQLTSPNRGADALVAVLVSESTAAGKLGFGQPLPAAPAGVDEAEPAACVEAGNIWLFWASRRDAAWKIWYARFDGSQWQAPKALTSGPQGDREPFVLFDPAAGGRLWVFWSRKKDNGLWNVFSRTTAVLNFPALTSADWTEAENMPAPANFDNREPAATIAPGGEVELYVASNRADGWNIWTRTVTTALQGGESAATSGQATQRAPAPLRVSAALLRLFFRSNDTITYTSTVYPKAQTCDARYSGSTTLDIRNPLKLSLRGSIRDLQRYTHDSRRDATAGGSQGGILNESGLYARDCVCVYLTPDTDDEAFILRQHQLFVNALGRFVPIQVRLAFLIDQVFPEPVYTYDQPGAAPQALIAERMIDSILPEVLPPLQDSFIDSMPGLPSLRAGASAETAGLPDLDLNPPDLGSRSHNPNFAEGE